MADIILPQVNIIDYNENEHILVEHNGTIYRISIQEIINIIDERLGVIENGSY